MPGEKIAEKLTSYLRKKQESKSSNTYEPLSDAHAGILTFFWKQRQTGRRGGGAWWMNITRPAWRESLPPVMFSRSTTWWISYPWRRRVWRMAWSGISGQAICLLSPGDKDRRTGDGSRRAGAGERCGGD